MTQGWKILFEVNGEWIGVQSLFNFTSTKKKHSIKDRSVEMCKTGFHFSPNLDEAFSYVFVGCNWRKMYDENNLVLVEVETRNCRKNTICVEESKAVCRDIEFIHAYRVRLDSIAEAIKEERGEETWKELSWIGAYGILRYLNSQIYNDPEGREPNLTLEHPLIGELLLKSAEKIY